MTASKEFTPGEKQQMMADKDLWNAYININCSCDGSGEPVVLCEGHQALVNLLHRMNDVRDQALKMVAETAETLAALEEGL